MKKDSILKCCPFKFGAGEESRTLDLNLGKVALYQLSYSRRASNYRGFSSPPFCGRGQCLTDRGGVAGWVLPSGLGGTAAAATGSSSGRGVG